MSFKFMSRLFPRPVSREELELRYLSQSVSLYDLERREAEIAGGLFRQY